MKFELTIEFLLLVDHTIDELKLLTIHMENKGFSLWLGHSEKRIDSEKAAHILYAPDLDKDEMEYLYIGYETTFIKVFSYNEEGRLQLMFYPDWYKWEKILKGWDFLEVDVPKYIILLTQLLEDYFIWSMEVSIENG